MTTMATIDNRRTATMTHSLPMSKCHPKFVPARRPWQPANNLTPAITDWTLSWAPKWARVKALSEF